MTLLERWLATPSEPRRFNGEPDLLLLVSEMLPTRLSEPRLLATPGTLSIALSSGVQRRLQPGCRAVSNVTAKKSPLLLLFNTTRMGLLLLFNTTRAHTPDPQAQESPLLLLLNTTRARAHTPDPQAREPLSQWTEVWPTRPMRTQDVLTPAVNRRSLGEERAPG